MTMYEGQPAGFDLYEGAIKGDSLVENFGRTRWSAGDIPVVISGSVSTTSPAEGVVSYAPLIVPSGSAPIDQIIAEVTGAGTAGAVVRLGVYDSDGPGGRPGSLLADAGTVDGTVVVAHPLAAVIDLGGRGWVWLAAVTQGAAATRPTLRSATNGLQGLIPVFDTSFPGASLRNGYYSTGVSGALPATATIAGTATSTPRMAVRAA